jgi:hypothetical protein
LNAAKATADSDGNRFQFINSRTDFFTGRVTRRLGLDLLFFDLMIFWLSSLAFTFHVGPDEEGVRSQKSADLDWDA